jgi:uncharacterized protein YneF (UPF0154 family)
MLTAFDMPTPFSSMGKRNASNVPGQALTMINDPLLHWVARKWAERELGESRSDDERVHRMLMAVTGRRPSSEQLQMSMEYLTEERKLSGSSDPKEREIEIWSNLAHAVLNSKNMLFRF